jgi:anti-sigma B factor antagonist
VTAPVHPRGRRISSRGALPEPIVIAPTGELDLGTVTAFREWLDEKVQGDSRGVVVDLSDVAFIDSTGLRVVLELHRRLRAEQRPLAIVAPRGTMAAEVLTLTGLRRALPVHESRGSALRAA